MNIILLFVVVSADLALATLSDGESRQRMAWPPMFWYRGPHRPPEMIVMRPPATKIQRHKKSPSIAEQQQIYASHNGNLMTNNQQHYFPRLPPSNANNNNFTSVYFNYDSPLRLPYRQLTHHPYQIATPDYDQNVYNQLRFRSTASVPRRTRPTTMATTRPRVTPKQTNNKRRAAQHRNINSRIYSRNYTQYSNPNNRQHQRPKFDEMDHYDGGFARLDTDQQIPSPPLRHLDNYYSRPQQPSYDFENDEIGNFPKSSPNVQRQRPKTSDAEAAVKRRDEYKWKQSNSRRFDTSTEKSQDANDDVYSVYDDAEEVFNKGYESLRNGQHQTAKQKRQRQ
ncbi:hypothetical protein CHUAL_013712 [Chamberlinius hualienensis]